MAIMSKLAISRRRRGLFLAVSFMILGISQPSPEDRERIEENAGL